MGIYLHMIVVYFLELVVGISAPAVGIHRYGGMDWKIGYIHDITSAGLEKKQGN